MADRIKTVKQKNKATRLLQLVLAMTCVIVIFLVFYMSVGLSELISVDANVVAENTIEQNERLLRYVLDNNMNSIEIIARQLSSIRGDNDIVEQMDVLDDKLNFSFLRYANGNVIYNQNGTVKVNQNSAVTALIKANRRGMTEAFVENDSGERMIAFYSPIFDNDAISGVIGYYPLSTLQKDSYFEALKESGNSACIVNAKGDIIVGGIYDSANETNIISYTDDKFSSDNQSLKSLRNQLNGKTAGTAVYSVAGNKIICCTPIQFTSVKWYLVEINEALGGETLTGRVITRIITVIVAFVVLVLLFSFYLFRTRGKSGNAVDPLTGDMSYDMFKKQASELIKLNSRTNYALLYIDVKNFEYINDHFGYDVSSNTVLFISKVIKKILLQNELYARITADHFILLLKYHDIQEIITRFKALSAIVNNYEELRNLNFNIRIGAGIYEIDRSAEYTIHEMADRAIIARKTMNVNSQDDYVIYDEKIRTNFVKVAEIESYMEKSLKDGDFKLYLQPKYSIPHNSISGAEALVRWEHPTRGVIVPDDFVPLFEQNGFITRVDRFIFEETCKLIRRLLDEGKRTVTISINVSRVNAIEQSFLEYYIGTKKKYKIPDGLIEIEFTESFALNSYESLVKIIDTLKKNGLSCSIDDFGAGYSSFQALKELHMDVLKLDKMFLVKGTNPERDQILLSAIIKLAKDFGMKVIQEGVETPADLNRMRLLGCDTIQGFLYARPMTAEDFLRFLTTGFEGLPIETLREYYNEPNFFPQMPSTVELGLKKEIVNDDD